MDTKQEAKKPQGPVVEVTQLPKKKYSSPNVLGKIRKAANKMFGL